MPLFQTMTERANVLFDREHIGEIALDTFDNIDGPALAVVAQRLSIARTSLEWNYLAGWPTVLQETIRGILRASVAVSRSAASPGERRPVTMAWVPAYDYCVSVWEARSTSVSAGAVTVVLSGPYPDNQLTGS